MEYLYTGILLIHLSLYLTLNGLHVQLHAISRCAGDTCESGVGVYPHCTECNKYIYCVFGYAVERTCPENLVFDITYGTCNFPKNAKCWNNTTLTPGRIGIECTNNDPAEEASMNTDDPPKDATMNTDDPPEDATMNTDDPPKDATMNTDDPPEDATMNTDDPPEDATMNTDDPPEDATMNTDDPPEDDTMNTDDPPGEVSSYTDDPPAEAKINTDGPPEDATMNTDDPPKDATMNTGKVTMKSDDPIDEVIKTAEPNNDVKEQQPEVTTNTDDPPEEWNRQYSINPDFPQNQDPAESNTASKTNNQVDKQPLDTFNDAPKVEVPCVQNCNGMPQGNYQSCDGCTKFISCMWGMKLDNTCFSGLYWDDISKMCVTHSTTC